MKTSILKGLKKFIIDLSQKFDNFLTINEICFDTSFS